MAFGHPTEITVEAAGAVVMDTALERADELLHFARRMRRVALESAGGGMALSGVGMLMAFGGHLAPVAGAFLTRIAPGAILAGLSGERALMSRRVSYALIGTILSTVAPIGLVMVRLGAAGAAGMGLGLAIAKGIVDLHDGTIVARRDVPASGAEFEVRLPLVPVADNAVAS